MLKQLSRPILLTLLFITTLFQSSAYADRLKQTRIEGVLFFKADCEECIKLIERDIPSTLKEKNSNLTLLAINNSTQEGGTIYLQSLFERGLPKSLDLPVLYFNQRYISGKDLILEAIQTSSNSEKEVPQIDWFSESELTVSTNNSNSDLRYSAFQLVSAATYSSAKLGLKMSVLKNNFLKDPIANSLAVLVLAFLLGSLIKSIQTIRYPKKQQNTEISILIPILSLVAIVIAYYLFYSGIADSSLVCGPVGHCNTVQQSEYATLFGLIPVSLLGILGYLGIILAWGLAKFGKKTLRGDSVLSIWILSVLSTTFFIYLTFLEPFVIGATCLWCLTTALITIVVLHLSTKSAAAILHSSEPSLFKKVLYK